MSFFAKVSGNTVSLCSLEQPDRVLEKLPIIPAEDQHRSFILSTWVKSYEPFIRRLTVGGLPILPNDYRYGESKRAERLWTNTKVVVSPEDSYAIHGWICSEEGHVHYTYVPPHMRLKGLCRGLVESAVGTEYSVSLPWPTVPKGHIVRYNPWA